MTTGQDRPGAPASVSTHILDTSAGRPAADVAVALAARAGRAAAWADLGTARTGTDGRCTDLPALPDGTTQVRLRFDTEAYATGRPGAPAGPDPAPQDTARTGGSGAFFPEVTVAFAVEPGQHYHVPLLLSPYGYAVYRGS